MTRTLLEDWAVSRKGRSSKVKRMGEDSEKRSVYHCLVITWPTPADGQDACFGYFPCGQLFRSRSAATDEGPARESRAGASAASRRSHDGLRHGRTDRTICGRGF